MKKILFGMVILATMLMSKDFETQKGAIHYKDRSLDVSSSHSNSLSNKKVKDGLGYKDVRVEEMSKADVALLYKHKCRKCHGKKGRNLSANYARDLGNIGRNELEHILVRYAAGKPVDGLYSNIMTDRLRSISRVKISSLAKYISETF